MVSARKRRAREKVEGEGDCRRREGNDGRHGRSERTKQCAVIMISSRVVGLIVWAGRQKRKKPTDQNRVDESEPAGKASGTP